MVDLEKSTGVDELPDRIRKIWLSLKRVDKRIRLTVLPDRKSKAPTPVSPALAQDLRDVLRMTDGRIRPSLSSTAGPYVPYRKAGHGPAMIAPSAVRSCVWR